MQEPLRNSISRAALLQQGAIKLTIRRTLWPSFISFTWYRRIRWPDARDYVRDGEIWRPLAHTAHVFNSKINLLELCDKKLQRPARTIIPRMSTMELRLRRNPFANQAKAVRLFRIDPSMTDGELLFCCPPRI